MNLDKDLRGLVSRDHQVNRFSQVIFEIYLSILVELFMMSVHDIVLRKILQRLRSVF